jgi:hypothetical protein
MVIASVRSSGQAMMALMRPQPISNRSAIKVIPTMRSFYPHKVTGAWRKRESFVTARGRAARSSPGKLAGNRVSPMPVALSIALALLAGAPGAAAGPPTPSDPPRVAPPVKQAEDGCAFSRESAEKGEIVVCAQKPQSYRLNPDVMAAKKAMRDTGGPKPPERFVNTDCKTIGPMGCRGQATVNLVGTALALAKMADQLSKGASLASLFITDPHPSEYQVYQAAKADREAREEEARVQEAVKAQAAAAKASQPAAAPAKTSDPR